MITYEKQRGENATGIVGIITLLKHPFFVKICVEEVTITMLFPIGK